MKSTVKKYVVIAVLLCAVIPVFAFEEGWVLNMRADIGGSFTTPSISESDLSKLGANKMEGMVGFIGGGRAEVGYIFDTAKHFKLPEDHWFSGIGAFGRVGVTQGYSGQISGSLVDVGGEQKQVDVFVNVFYTPVITMGAAGKAYFFDNKLAVGLSVGAEMIADTSPSYEIYSTDPETIGAEVGTIIVDEWMMTHMNPFMATFDVFAEYNVKILDTTELILGGYIGYNIYSPGYVTMPKKVLDMAITNFDFDPHAPLKSYFINSLDFGLTFALGFKL